MTELANQFGKLILEELKLIRQDMNSQLGKVQETLETIFSDKISQHHTSNLVANNTDPNRECKGNVYPDDSNNVSLQLCGYDNTLLEYEFENGLWPVVEEVSHATSMLKNVVAEQRNNETGNKNGIIVKMENISENTLDVTATTSSFGNFATGLSNSVMFDVVENENLIGTDCFNYSDGNFRDLSSISVVKRKRKPPRKKCYPTEDPWLCVHCSKTFSTQSGLKLHLRTHGSGGNLFAGTGDTFLDMSMKENNHGNIQKISPTIRDTTISTVVSAETAENIKTIPKQFKKTTMQHENQPVDITNQNSSTNNFGCCPYCGKYFGSLQGLQSHFLSHTKPFKCHHCGKGHSDRRNLRQHLTSKKYCSIYQSERSKYQRHVCNMCGKIFLKKAPLELHIAAHLNKTPYLCIFCGNTYMTAKGLKGHMNTIHIGTA